MPEGVFVFVSVVLAAGVPNEPLFTAEVVYTRTVSCLASAGTAGTPAATDLVRGLLWWHPGAAPVRLPNGREAKHTAITTL